jgi:hypothetical protein
MIAFADKELKAVRILIILTAILVSARWLMWSFETDSPWWGRAIAGAAIGSLLLGGLPALWKWSKQRNIDGDSENIAQISINEKSNTSAKKEEPAVPRVGITVIGPGTFTSDHVKVQGFDQGIKREGGGNTHLRNTDVIGPGEKK